MYLNEFLKKWNYDMYNGYYNDQSKSIIFQYPAFEPQSYEKNHNFLYESGEYTCQHIECIIDHGP